MKIHLLSITVLFLILNGQAQSISLDNCGLDAKSKLNDCETEYFKNDLKALAAIDLSKKHFAFASGNLGRTIISKKDYFDKWGKKYQSNKSNVVNTLLVLTEAEKKISGGYDFIIVSWTKIHPAGTSRKRLVNRVMKQSGKITDD
jgi:hypothetical protein